MYDSMQRDEINELKRELEEAKHTILQLTQQLGIMEQLLTQERSARESAEFAAQQAASAAEVAARAAVEASQHQSVSAFTDQERISLENMLQQERVAREQAELIAQQPAEAAEVAAHAAIEASRHNSAPALVITDSKTDYLFERSRSEDFDMEDVSNAQAPGKAVDALSKTSRESTKAQPPQGRNKARSSPAEDKKMSLAEARKAAQEKMERRIQERTKSLLSK